MSAIRSRSASVALAAALAATGSVISAPAPALAVSGQSDSSVSHAFTAKLQIGSGETKRTCSGALVDHQWILTAASCFVDDPSRHSTLAAGKPTTLIRAVVGRAKLSAAGGTPSEIVEDLFDPNSTTTTIVELVPNKSRDMVMARLAKPADNVTPITLATEAPAPEEVLTATGFGRSKDTWIPNLRSSAQFKVTSVSDTAVGITGTSDAGICKGDTGGPAFRMRNGAPELVAIHSRSWQGGCLHEGETRTDAVESRVDTAHDWIQRIRLASQHQNATDRMAAADFNGDGRPDVATVLTDGNLHAYYTTADGTLQYGRELWKHDGSWGKKTQLLAGDFNGDGHGDIAATNATGDLHLYPGTKSGQLRAPLQMWKDSSWGGFRSIATYRATGWTRDGLIGVTPTGSLYAYPTGTNGVLDGTRTKAWEDNSWDKKLISTSEFTSDTHNDIAAISQKGQLDLYRGSAAGTFAYGGVMWPDPSWSTFPVIMGGDFNTDGKADLAAVNSSGGLYLYPGDGKGKLGERSLMWPAKQ
ncbi:esterase (plasmid) [Streptomyces clavuligerus]|uniref:trypsin-like serine protease n=1 Tax=Streptomyces clavuligerus TaxID=1901 RepID=UPI000492388C|nr:trypsin-like serine protease [Streptomyces clavuligerus]ANW22621.1 esterase [Streptomyces clavuligerus]WDN55820.1 trypsin-like serine protease [Streptomyces clavuligerus]